MHAAAVQPITDRVEGAKSGEIEEEGRKEVGERERGRVVGWGLTKLWQSGGIMCLHNNT